MNIAALDNALDNTISMLNQVYNTHPNLSTVWKSYLLNKYQDLLNDIEQCSRAFGDDDVVDDIPLMTILLLIVDSQHSK